VEFSKRWGPYFFSAFVALVIAIVPVFIFLKDSPILMQNALIILSILAAICLILTIIALFFDLVDARKRDGKQNRIDHSIDSWIIAMKEMKASRDRKKQG
jgi:nitrogen fixation/metabolism regulation signal transduction histidine kinase